MYAMVIPDVGRRVSKCIVDYLEKEGKGREWYRLNRQEILDMRIANIGENIATSLSTWNNKNADKAKDLMAIMECAPTIVAPKVQPVSNAPLNGEKIMFTGTLKNMNITRNEATELVQKLGGEVTSALGQTTILIIGTSPGSKVGRAQGRGIRMMYENEFEKICQDNNI